MSHRLSIPTSNRQALTLSTCHHKALKIGGRQCFQNLHTSAHFHRSSGVMRRVVIKKSHVLHPVSPKSKRSSPSGLSKVIVACTSDNKTNVSAGSESHCLLKIVLPCGIHGILNISSQDTLSGRSVERVAAHIGEVLAHNGRRRGVVCFGQEPITLKLFTYFCIKRSERIVMAYACNWNGRNESPMDGLVESSPFSCIRPTFIARKTSTMGGRKREGRG